MSASPAAIAGLARRAALISACVLMAGTVIAAPAGAKARPAAATQPQPSMSCVSVGRFASCASWHDVMLSLPPATWSFFPQ
jgi:hypothetical protein